MSWFRKKGKYWYFVEKINGKEVQHYIGSDLKIKEKLLPNKKAGGHFRSKTDRKTLV